MTKQVIIIKSITHISFIRENDKNKVQPTHKDVKFYKCPYY